MYFVPKKLYSKVFIIVCYNNIQTIIEGKQTTEGLKIIDGKIYILSPYTCTTICNSDE